ncbi:MAG: hypothetical protein HFJ06_16165 [Lachnospiraceae bacterium]|nr:hypothetical protein [Lachnospiraceae bacterium]
MEKENDNMKSKIDTDDKNTSNIKKPEENLYSENALELSRMSFKERQSYKKELQAKRLASMDARERRRYILHYYKWHFAGGIFLILFLYLLGHTIYKANLPTELIVAITNDGPNAIAEKYIPDTFRSYYDLDSKNIIQVFTDLTIDNTDDVAIRQSTLTDYEKMIVYITSDKLDAIIGNEQTLNYYRSTGDIAVIDACIDKELYSQIEKYIVTASSDDTYMNEGKPYSAAIDISGTEFANNCNLSYDKVYLMIPNNRYTDNTNTIRLIRLIFGL